jgi:activator of HSP90 ATPase
MLCPYDGKANGEVWWARESKACCGGYEMTKAIEQSVRFNASPAQLFEMYLDSKKHSAATGGAARMSRKPGGKFTAWDAQLSGRNLLIVKNRMIVQAWRSTHWKASETDSILILRFSKAPGGGQVDLTHVNVPEHDHAGVTKGWPKYYWEPWKKYLKGRAK